MVWVDRKFIFKPSGEHGWMNSHAQVPVVLRLDDRFRVYLSCREFPNESQVCIIDLNLDNPTEIIELYPKKVLPLGEPGMFDEFGVMPAAVVKHDKEVFLYTTGWQRGITVPYLNAIGLAVSQDEGLTFSKPFPGPVVSPTRMEPYSAMSPFVLKEKGIWRMWYSSGVDWFKGESKYEPVYTIKYAYSTNGLDWVQPNITCIPNSNSEEAITRPTVKFMNEKYHMWFCFRGSTDFRGGKNSFKIGYATSEDGIVWRRKDEKGGLMPSGSGWDSNMTAYPYVTTDSQGDTIMFYCGNFFGQEGFGYAKWTN
jgi:hypothetical protein